MERTNNIKYRQEAGAGIGISGPITTNRYSIGATIGSGAWGVVYSARDNVLDQDELAIKVLDLTDLAEDQMNYRGLSPLQVMVKDGGKLAACSRVVPRRLEFDNNNIPFLVMPKYKEHLSDVLMDKNKKTGQMRPVEERSYLKHGLNGEQIISFLRDFAIAYEEIHGVLGRVHGDGKPDNIPLDNEHKFALFNDFGSSTYLAPRKDGKPRDNIGFLYTRAYELFKDKREGAFGKIEDTHPTERSDVFAFASLAYRLFTGRYLWEDELQNVANPDEYFEGLGSNGIEKALKSKMKRVPRGFRKLLRECASFWEHKRPRNGKELREGLEKVLKKQDRREMLMNGIVKHLPKALWPLAIAGTIGIMTLLPKPKDTVPILKPSEYDSVLVMNRMPEEGEPMLFEAEDPINFHAEIISGFAIGNHNLRGFTGNKNVLVLLNNYANAHDVIKEKLTTEAQMGIYLHNTSEAERANPIDSRFGPVIKSIEYAMNYPGVKHENGRYDLEDICTIARVGPVKFEHIREVSGSKQFARYIDAADNNGTPIISEEDKLFIKTWIAYLHANN